MPLRRWAKRLVSAWVRRRVARCAILAPSVTVGPWARIANRGDRAHVTLGARVSLHGSIDVEAGGRVTIGENTTVRFKSEIECVTSVWIGRDVIISNNVIIADHDSHPVSPRLRRELSQSDHEGPLWSWTRANSAPVTIEDNVWIGRRAIVLKGVTIGRGSVVAAAATVTKSVPPFSLCYGNPCVIRAGAYEDNEEG